MGVLKYFPGLSTTPASTTPASTTPASTAKSSTEDKKTPWWVWLIVALVGMGIAAAFASK